jgi:hypothetical protein
MELTVLQGTFCICKVKEFSAIDFSDPYCFVARTPDEISLVCSSTHIPENTIAVDDGWKGFHVAGILDFALVGILARISNTLAANNISLFAISTYNTDYILVRQSFFGEALKVLEADGFVIA